MRFRASRDCRCGRCGVQTVNRLRTIFILIFATTLCLLSSSCGSTASTTGPTENGGERVDEGSYDEAQLGDEVFDELKAERSIIEASSMYDSLRPVVDPIARTVQPRYEH